MAPPAEVVRIVGRRLAFENLEVRRVLAYVEYVSGMFGGLETDNLVDTSGNTTLQRIWITEAKDDSDRMISHPLPTDPPSDAEPMVLGVHEGRVYVGNSTQYVSEVHLQTEIRTRQTLPSQSRSIDLSVSTPVPFVFRIMPDEGEPDRKRVKLGLKADLIFAAVEDGASLAYQVSYIAPNRTETIGGNATLFQPGDPQITFDRIQRDLSIDAQIGDDIQISIAIQGSLSTPPNRPSGGNQLPGIYATVDFDLKLLPTVNLTLNNPQFDFANGKLDFDYVVLNEPLDASTEVAFHWVKNDEQFEVFDPQMALSTASVRFSIPPSPVGFHAGSIDIADLPTPPLDGTRLVLQIDPDQQINEESESDNWLDAFAGHGALSEFSHQDELHINRLAFRYLVPLASREGFDLKFFAIPDLDFPALGFNLTSVQGYLDLFRQHARLLDYSIHVSPQAIDAAPELELENDH